MSYSTEINGLYDNSQKLTHHQYFEEYQTKEEAAKREYLIKKWSREKMKHC